MKPAIALCLAVTLLQGQPGYAQDRSKIFGLYSAGGMSCDADQAGLPGGPVSIESSSLKIAGITCQLSGRTNISRMNAVLFDASCGFSGKNKQDRMFIQRNREGVTLVAEGLGTFILGECHKP